MRLSYSMVLLLALPLLSGCGQPKAPELGHQPIQAPASGKGTKEIALLKLVNKVPQGTKIGRLSAGVACVTHGVMKWTVGQGALRMDSLDQAFIDELKQANYNVVGDPTDLFEDKRGTAEYIVGGAITQVGLDVCYTGMFNSGSGKASAGIKIEWQIYNSLDRKTVFRATTVGTSNESFTEGKYSDAVSTAFANAVRGLLAEKGFYNAVADSSPAGSSSGSSSPPGSAPVGPLVDKPVSNPQALPSVQASPSPAHQGKMHQKGTLSLDEAIKRVVVLQLPGGHGSGFLVGNSGYIITNHHVVEGFKKIRIIYANGVMAEGQVLKSEPRQDVALVQVDNQPLSGLPVRLEDLPVGTDVYAIGAPKDMAYQNSITKGISGVYRTDKKGRWLQSDAVVNHGNSGGPLVDAQGRVVGMCSWKVLGEDSQGLGFFVPIAEAVRILNIPLK